MTVYGTPYSTPLNTTSFQGTQPGNPVQATLQMSNPGVGMFPPGSNNSSGDSTLAAMSRGAMPANALVGNIGGIPPVDTLLTRLSAANANGYGETSAGGVFIGNNAAAGGAGPGAGGLNQTPGPASGTDYAIPSQASALAIANAMQTNPPTFGG